MIVERTDDGRPGLVITFPTRDKIGSSVILAALGFFFLLYVMNTKELNISVLKVAAFIIVAVSVIIIPTLTKIVVSRTSIRTRVLRWREVELPGPVTVERKGQLICLRGRNLDFEYRFPKYMKHGEELERRLRAFFEGV